MRQPYTNRYFPPAPELAIEIIDVASQHSIGPFTALVDTGTDMTAVPMAILEQIEAPFSRTAFVQAHWGARLPVSLFTIDLRVSTFIIPGIEVIGDERENEIILGRDVLNRLWVGLDGPAQITEVAAKRSRRR